MPYNQEALQKLFQEYYILAISQFAPALNSRQQAEPQYHEAIVDGGYDWDEEQKIYVEKRLGQYIVALPNDQFIWVLGDIGKILKNGDKLKIWLDGRGDTFVSQLLGAMGQKDDIKFSGTGERGVKYEPKPVPKGNETDMLIAKLKKQAGAGGRLPADLMIDLGLKAQKEKNQKLLDFLKTITPIKENVIKRSQLNNLIREIVKRIINEAWEDDEREEKIAMNLARELWGDTGWGVKNSRTTQYGTVYKLSYNKPISRFLWKTPQGQWKSLDPETKKWQDIKSSVGEARYTVVPKDTRTKITGQGKTGSSLKNGKPRRIGPELDEPDVRVGTSQTGTSKEVEEMTGTGAVSPISTPFAFKKKKTMESMWNKLRQVVTKKLVDKIGDEKIRTLAKQFEAEGDDPNEAYAKALSALAQTGGKKIDEMTTTGAVTGYNIPAAFSKRGGSNKGVEGSESLGYTLTPQGKKEMNRRADRLYEDGQK